MTSLISIPIYLCRNTLRRWIENPASPTTKFCIPFLFAILALMVFGVFQQFEAQIRAQLAKSDLRTIRTQESLFSEAAMARLASGTNDSDLWSDYCESFESFQQAPVLARSKLFQDIPVLSYDESPPFTSIPEMPLGEARTAILFSDQPFPGGEDFIDISGTRVAVTTKPLPPILKSHYNAPAIALIPAEFIEPLLERGFTQFQVFTPNADISSSSLESLIRAHAHAEGRRLVISSSLDILEQLGQLLKYQQSSRLVIGIVVTIILSLTFGSLSFLEFRQDRYLFSLLRSFGVRGISLLSHYLIETSILAAAGLAAASAAYRSLTPLLFKISQGVDPQQSLPVGMFSQPAALDYQILIIATAIGVAISSIPVVSGLLKQPGLFLP